MKTFSKCFALLMALSFSNPMMSQENTKNYLEVEFLSDSPTDYGIRLFGTEDGKITVSWGEESEVLDLKKEGTFLKGVSKGKILKVEGNIATIECSNAPVKAIRVDHMPVLREYITRRTAVDQVDLSQNPNLELLYIENTSVSSLDLTKNTKLTDLIIPTNRLKSVKLPEQNELRKIDCMSNGQLTEMNIEVAKKLKRLVTIQTNISNLDLKEMKDLTFLHIGLGMAPINLQLPVESKVDTLFAPMAGLTDIDLSTSKKLRALSIDNNWGLAAIDLSQLGELRSLEAEGCAMSEINTSGNPKLEYFKCSTTPVTSLDLSNNSELLYLFCFGTGISQLDLSKCNKLQELDCSYNMELSQLSLPKTVYSVDCSCCQLSALEVSHLDSLSTLTCSENQIKELNVGKNHTQLTALNANDNQIEKINLKELPLLYNVNLSNNPIDELDVSAANLLVLLNVNGTKMDAPHLDALYTSLCDANDAPYTPQLENETDGAATSNTSIATAKGWMVSVAGDGSGSVTGIETTCAEPSLVEYANGFAVEGVGNQPCWVSVFDMQGKCVFSKTLKPNHCFVEIAQPGLYLVRINNNKTLKVVKH